MWAFSPNMLLRRDGIWNLNTVWEVKFFEISRREFQILSLCESMFAINDSIQVELSPVQLGPRAGLYGAQFA